MGFGLVIGFVEHLHIVTRSNYRTTVNSHTQHFTTACTKSSQSAVFHQALSGNSFQNRRPLNFCVHALTGW
jgi:hypothetical protein